jgi:flagellar protein FliS
MTQAEISREYRRSQIRGASSVECTIMLYDLAIADLRKAIQCIDDGDIEGRTNALVHSLHVLAHLQGSLQMESGGEAAKHLYSFYSLARAKVLEGQMKCRAKLLSEIVEAMLRVRTMWEEVKQDAKAAGMPEPWPIPQEPSCVSSAWSA